MPALGYGFSDCHCARDAWGSVAYGFIPFPYGNPLVNLETKHGERIRTEDLEFQLAAAVYIARNLPRMNDGRPAREVRATRHDSIPRDS